MNKSLKSKQTSDKVLK